MLPLTKIFQKVLFRLIRVICYKLNPLSQEARPHLDVVLKEETIVLTSTYKTDDEMPLPQIFVGVMLGQLVDYCTYYDVGNNQDDSVGPVRVKPDEHGANYTSNKSRY